MQINQNIPAMFAYRAVTNAQNGLATTTERLSSGLRINRAADDAAGLAISEKLRAQKNGLDQALRNTSDGISLLRTAEGGLNETHAILQRMRVLAVQAANTGVMTTDTLRAIQAEMTQLTADIDRIAYTSEFNGQPLLDGTFRDKSLQVGANAGDTKVVSIVSSVTEAIPPQPAGVALWNVYDQADPVTSPVSVTHTVGGETTEVSVSLDPLPDNVADLVAKLNEDPAFGASFTASVGSHTFGDGTTVAKNVIIMAKTPGAGAVATSGIPHDESEMQTNPGRDEVPARFGGFGAADILGVVDITREAGSSTSTVTVGGGPSKGFGTCNDVVTPPGEVTVTNTWNSGASDAITQIDNAIAIVSRGRTDLGATANALEHTARSVGVSADNLASSESRIRDADLAKEIAEMQRWQILAQASMEMLSRANMVPQSVIKLLQ